MVVGVVMIVVVVVKGVVLVTVTVVEVVRLDGGVVEDTQR